MKFIVSSTYLLKQLQVLGGVINNSNIDAESFAEVCSAVPIPVLIAGGPRGTSFTELLRIVEQSISAGGAGVCMGRQVFGADDPVSHIRALKSVIHEGMSADEAAEHLR